MIQTQTLGLTTSQLSTILGKSDQYADIIESVLEDPALPRIAGLIRTIKAMEKASTPVKSGGAPTAATKGVGLQRIVKPLEIYVWYRQNRVLAYVLAAATILVPAGIGYGIGRWSR